MASRMLSRLWYRSRLFWALALLLAYLAFGYLLLPRLVADALRGAVKDHLGWQAVVGEVTFNPFDLALVIGDVVVSDTQNRRTLGFGALTVNVDAAALFDRALGFELTELRQPYILLEVLEGGTETNIGHALRAAAASPSAAIADSAVAPGPTDRPAGEGAVEDASEKGRAEQDAAARDTAASDSVAKDGATREGLPRLRFDELRIVDAEIEIHDYSHGDRVDHRLAPLNFSLLDFTTYHDKADRYRITIDLGRQQVLQWSGTVNTVNRRSQGEIELTGLRLGDLQPYMKPYSGYRVTDGLLSLGLRYDLAVEGDALDLRVDQGRLGVAGLALAFHGGQGQDPAFLTLERLEVGDVLFDLRQREARAGGLLLDGLLFKAHRDPLGRFAFLPAPAAPASADPVVEGADVMTTEAATAEPPESVPAPAEPSGAAPSPDGSAVASTSPPLQWALERFELNNGRIEWLDETLGTLSDAATPTAAPTPTATTAATDADAANSAVTAAGSMAEEPVPDTHPSGTVSAHHGARLAVDAVTVLVRQISQDLTQAVPFEVKFRIQDSGPALLSGSVVPADGRFTAQVAIEQLALPILQPYLDSLAAVTLKSGTFTLQGDVEVDPRSDALGHFRGHTRVEGIDVVEQAEGEPLVAWKQVGLTALDVGFRPLSIQAEELLIDAPQAHVLIAEDGQTNFAGLVRKQSSVASERLAGQASAVASDNDRAASRPAASAGSAAAEDDSGGADISIARLVIRDGQFGFRDLTYEPAVDIELIGFSGAITNLSSQQKARSRVDLAGTLDDYGKLTIAGEINPLSDPLFSDLRLDLKNFDMTELSPYTGRFVGNKVEKGKMNLNLDYLIDQRRVKAGNRVLLDQFTLGDTVASAEATTLPVSLAIALMTDSSGRIDIDLPVEGNLDDPEFRIGSVVLTALGNLITKAATSPFALLEGLAGTDQGLDQVHFQPGSAALDAEQEESLRSLASALRERPALRLGIRGVSNPRLDEGPLRQARLDKQIAGQRKKLGTQAGEEQVLLALLDKQGLMSLLATLPDAGPDPLARQQALTALLLEGVKVGPQSLRKLADRRAATIRKHLVDIGGMAADRVFVLDPLTADQPEEATAVVVTFSLEAS